jgi:hypothetical protein
MPPACSGGNIVAARSPALNAMAGDHIAQLAAYFIADLAAQAAAGDYLAH